MRLVESFMSNIYIYIYKESHSVVGIFLFINDVLLSGIMYAFLMDAQ